MISKAKARRQTSMLGLTLTCVICCLTILSLERSLFKNRGVNPTLEMSNSRSRIAEAEPKSNILILTYAWGSLRGNKNIDLFMRSLRATGSEADVVVITHGIDIDNDTRTLMKQCRFTILDVPREIILNSKTYKAQEFVLARFVAWADFIKHSGPNYTHIMTTDMDVFFQMDPSACMPIAPMLQLFEENRATILQECDLHTRWIASCPAVRGRSGADIFENIKHHGRICAGVIYGDYMSMNAFIGAIAEEVEKHLCNDQGLVNMLAWDSRLREEFGRITIFDCFTGPLKTMDVGGYRDEYGYVLNNNGKRYCMLHQFKEERNADFVKLLEMQLAAHRNATITGNPDKLFPSVELYALRDTRFKDNLHVAVHRMEKKGMLWPPLRVDRAIWEKSAWGVVKYL